MKVFFYSSPESYSTPFIAAAVRIQPRGFSLVSRFHASLASQPDSGRWLLPALGRAVTKSRAAELTHANTNRTHDADMDTDDPARGKHSPTERKSFQVTQSSARPRLFIAPIKFAESENSLFSRHRVCFKLKFSHLERASESFLIWGSRARAFSRSQPRLESECL